MSFHTHLHGPTVPSSGSSCRPQACRALVVSQGLDPSWLTTLASALAPLGLGMGHCMHLKWTGLEDRWCQGLDVKDTSMVYWVEVGVAYKIFQLVNLPTPGEIYQTHLDLHVQSLYFLLLKGLGQQEDGKLLYFISTWWRVNILIPCLPHFALKMSF